MTKGKAPAKPAAKSLPNSVWAMALSSLTRLECKAIENFFDEAASYFSSRLKDMRQAAGDGPHSDDEVDHYVDLRDELEAFELTNRYFAIVQAAGVFEGVSVRIIEAAVDAELLKRSDMYAKSGFVNARSVNEGYRLLDIVLADVDAALLKELASRRNLILHSGGRLARDEESKARYEPVRFLKISEGEVTAAIRLVARCAEYRIRRFQQRYCKRS